MRIPANDFFNGLNVDQVHYLKRFKKIGVSSPFLFTADDLEIIIDRLPVSRYKAAMVVNRALYFLNRRA
jgi:cobalamin biosynthesis Co2+ chelatase CbiK